MSPRAPLAAALFALALPLLAPAAARAKEDFSSALIETIAVAGAVHMLVGRGGNLAVSTGPDGTFLVDDQFAPLSGKILAAVAKLRAGPVRFVVNTHFHGDHTGGNEALGGAGAVIVAHRGVRERMSAPQFSALRNRTTPAAPPGALPIVTFTADVTFHLNGEDVHVFHVPNAHTDGDAVVHFRGSDVIHTGDVFFHGTYPFIDVESGGSIDGVLAAQERVLDLASEATRIIPGHGPLATPEALRGARALLVTARERTLAAIAEGQSLEAFVASAPFADLEATFGGGFLGSDAFATITWTDLSRRGTP